MQSRAVRASLSSALPLLPSGAGPRGLATMGGAAIAAPLLNGAKMASNFRFFTRMTTKTAAVSAPRHLAIDCSRTLFRTITSQAMVRSTAKRLVPAARAFATVGAGKRREDSGSELEGIAAEAEEDPLSPAQAMALCMNSVVKIFTTSSAPNYLQPWQHKPFSESTGSGFIIKGRKIITNAHVVADAVQVMVRRPGAADKYPARVAAAGHECDLAVLEVEDEEFWSMGGSEIDLDAAAAGATDAPAVAVAAAAEGAALAPAEDDSGVVSSDGSLRLSPHLPLLQDTVCVIGYPAGGDNLCITQGVVSRLEPVYYVHTGSHLLAIQIDAAINPGNSGGPAFVDGRVVGVAFQNVQNASSVGYIIPVPIIQHFLRDVAAGGYKTADRSGANLAPVALSTEAGKQSPSGTGPAERRGFCSIMISCQEAFNGSLQRFYGLTPAAAALASEPGDTSAANSPASSRRGRAVVEGHNNAAFVHTLPPVRPTLTISALPQQSEEGASKGDTVSVSGIATTATGSVAGSVAAALTPYHLATGVLVTSVSRLSPAFGLLQRNDVLLAVDDHPIAGDGTVHFRGHERIGFDYLFSLKFAGEQCKLTFLRRGDVASATTAGTPAAAAVTNARGAMPTVGVRSGARAGGVEVREAIVTMQPSQSLVSGHGYDKTTSYFIFGGLVFVPLSMPYLQEFGKDWYQQGPRDLVEIAVSGRPLFPGQEPVVVTQILPDPSTTGYSNMNDQSVRRVNGRWIKSLKHLKIITEEIVVRAALAFEGIEVPSTPTPATHPAPLAGTEGDAVDPAAVAAAVAAWAPYSTHSGLTSALNSATNPYFPYIASRSLALRPAPWLPGEDGLLSRAEPPGEKGAAAAFAAALGPDALVVEFGDQRSVILEVSAVVGAHERVMRRHNIPRQASVDLVGGST